MISMGMGDQNRINFFQLMWQKLVAYIRPGIDQNGGAIDLDKNSASLTPVAAIIRVACAPAGMMTGASIL